MTTGAGFALPPRKTNGTEDKTMNQTGQQTATRGLTRCSVGRTYHSAAVLAELTELAELKELKKSDLDSRGESSRRGLLNELKMASRSARAASRAHDQSCPICRAAVLGNAD
jgi:hypothetical protein